jgi:hypothetical protein
VPSRGCSDTSPAVARTPDCRSFALGTSALRVTRSEGLGPGMRCYFRSSESGSEPCFPGGGRRREELCDERQKFEHRGCSPRCPQADRPPPPPAGRWQVGPGRALGEEDQPDHRTPVSLRVHAPAQPSARRYAARPRFASTPHLRGGPGASASMTRGRKPARRSNSSTPSPTSSGSGPGNSCTNSAGSRRWPDAGKSTLQPLEGPGGKLHGRGPRSMRRRRRAASGAGAAPSP